MRERIDYRTAPRILTIALGGAVALMATLLALVVLYAADAQGAERRDTRAAVETARAAVPTVRAGVLVPAGGRSGVLTPAPWLPWWVDCDDLDTIEECAENLQELCQAAGHGSVDQTTVELHAGQHGGVLCIGECVHDGAVPFQDCREDEPAPTPQPEPGGPETVG